jgi:hypothetical protein
MSTTRVAGRMNPTMMTPMGAACASRAGHDQAPTELPRASRRPRPDSMRATRRWNELRPRERIAVALPIVGAVLAGVALGIVVRSVWAAIWLIALLAPIAVLCAVAVAALGESLVADQSPQWDALLARKGRRTLMATALVAVGLSTAGLLGVAMACSILGTAGGVVLGWRGRSRS